MYIKCWLGDVMKKIACRPWHRYDDNIKTVSSEIDYEDINWNKLGQANVRALS
jgi:hypothetical protein